MLQLQGSPCCCWTPVLRSVLKLGMGVLIMVAGISADLDILIVDLDKLDVQH